GGQLLRNAGAQGAQETAVPSQGRGHGCRDVPARGEGVADGGGSRILLRDRPLQGLAGAAGAGQCGAARRAQGAAEAGLRDAGAKVAAEGTRPVKLSALDEARSRLRFSRGLAGLSQASLSASSLTGPGSAGGSLPVLPAGAS